MSNQSQASKVAILGGGVGSMATAVQITNDPNWKEKFSSITIYQMGWRLGGKGASGRGKYDRIEEHGLHVWMGFYENSFHVIRKVYEELGREAGKPLATWEDAFKKHDFIVLMEKYNQSWRKWPLNFERNDQVPGSGKEVPSLWQHMLRALQMLEMVINSSDENQPKSWLGKVWKKIKLWLRAIGFGIEVIGIELGLSHIQGIRRHAHSLNGPSKDHDPEHHQVLHDKLTKLSNWAEEHYKDKLDDDLKRHEFVLLDFSIAIMKGVITHGLLKEEIDYDALDEHDAVDWLRQHGASEITCDSGLVHAMYDLMLAYENGDVKKPRFGAGSFLHFAIRMTLTYRGAIFWKMQAGMGDTIFAPIYEVLKKRGVKFEFFHCVDQLRLSEYGSQIETIDMDVQANLKSGTYDPLVEINELPCWPSEPNYDQLVEGEELKKENINLESFWTTWKPVDKKSLKRGEDFDIVVLGIPVASHPYICKALIDQNSMWSQMVENVKTTRTLALELWIQDDLKGLGWTEPSPIIDSYVEPFNTWADMSQLIVRENWPKNAPLNNIAYFCGPMEGGIPAKSASDTPEKETLAVKNLALDWLKKNPGFLWPKAVDSQGSLNWSILTDPEDRIGEARMEAQFWRANIDPSERYVLTVPKSTKHRLRTDETGFKNLIIAGDWTWSPMNVGCVEDTVMSGMMAANVMLGKAVDHGIIGYRRT